MEKTKNHAKMEQKIKILRENLAVIEKIIPGISSVKGTVYILDNKTLAKSLTLVTVDDGPVQERATLCNYCCELTKGLFGVTKSTKNL